MGNQQGGAEPRSVAGPQQSAGAEPHRPDVPAGPRKPARQAVRLPQLEGPERREHPGHGQRQGGPGAGVLP